MVELLPCLCGEESLKMRRDEIANVHDEYTTIRWAVICNSCNTIGQRKPDAIHVALAWNADKMAVTSSQEPT